MLFDIDASLATLARELGWTLETFQSNGEGDLVTCVGSREAALAVSPSFVPVDAAIIGIVDHYDAHR